MNNKIDSSYLSPLVVFILMGVIGVILLVVGITKSIEKKDMLIAPESRSGKLSVNMFNEIKNRQMVDNN